LEEHRRGIVYAETDFMLFTVLMKPFKWGMIDTNVKLTFKETDGTEHHVSLPIIGLVTPTNNIVLSDKHNSNLHDFLPQSTV
jgi:hypothetical protein